MNKEEVLPTNDHESSDVSIVVRVFEDSTVLVTMNPTPIIENQLIEI
jgi:hypothetical protein